VRKLFFNATDHSYLVINIYYANDANRLLGIWRDHEYSLTKNSVQKGESFLDGVVYRTATQSGPIGGGMSRAKMSIDHQKWCEIAMLHHWWKLATDPKPVIEGEDFWGRDTKDVPLPPIRSSTVPKKLR